MAARAVSLTREIIVEPGVVWAALATVDRWQRMLTTLVQLDRIEGTGLAVGAKWRETRRTFGATLVREMTVTQIADGYSLTIVTEADGATATITYRVKPSSLGTRLEADVTEDDPGAGFGKRLRGAMGGGAMKITRDILEQDLADFGASVRI